MMGGLAGNLYDAFNDLGRIFFTFLIGRSRAVRPSLQDSRVRVGSFLFFSLLGTVIVFIAFVIKPLESSGTEVGFFPTLVSSIIFGMLIGLFVGIIVAWILISYAHQIEREIERERLEAELQARREKYRDELIAQGVDPTEANIKAQRIGSGCGSVLAIAIIIIIAISVSLLL
jgi:hypothetical protein